MQRFQEDNLFARIGQAFFFFCFISFLFSHSFRFFFFLERDCLLCAICDTWLRACLRERVESALCCVLMEEVVFFLSFRQFKPIAVPRPVVLRQVQTLRVHTNDWAVACSVQQWV